jgi:two-component system OmpR family response regulator
MVEDDETIADFVSKGLTEAGYAVDVAADGEKGVELAVKGSYDAAIVDVMLPRLDGLALIDRVRARGIRTPVLILSARRTVDDRVKGLQAGGDDYLTKPFAFAELLARIRALLRRAESGRAPILKVGDLTLDPVSHRVTRGSRPIVVTAKQYAILEYLMRHADRVVTRTELGEHVWADEHDTLTNLVDVHMSHLRRKVDSEGTVPLIHTVRGRGYRLSERPE